MKSVPTFATPANYWTLPSFLTATALAILKQRAGPWQKVMTATLLVLFAGVHWAGAASAGGDPLAEIKGYLVFKLERMDAAAHDFVANANAYQAIIDKPGGDYNRAATEQGPELLQLVTKMQDNYRVYHNHGYETSKGLQPAPGPWCTTTRISMAASRSPRHRRIHPILRWF